MARKTKKAPREVQERVVWETQTFRVTTRAPGEYDLYVKDAWHGTHKTADAAIAAAHRWLQDEMRQSTA